LPQRFTSHGSGYEKIFGQAFFRKVVVKPLRRFITPLIGFSIKPFQKRLAVKQFFEKLQ
jgi:hypothetical protein